MKKILTNTLWIALNKVTGILFPLITYGYVSRVLGVENIGSYNYAVSIVDYFVLIASLGINSYAIREGTKRRDDEESVSKFISEIFTINLWSASIAYLIFLLTIFIFKERLDSYMVMLGICSITIIIVPFQMEWIFSVYESFKLVAYRTIVLRILNIFLIFAFIKDGNDIIRYALIMTLNSVLIAAYNFRYARSSAKICICHCVKDEMKHFKSILTMFSTTIAISLYTKSDITMLGIFNGDYEVGLYSNAVKIYSIADSMIASIAEAAYPNIVEKRGKSSDLTKEHIRKIFVLILIIVLPISTGIACLSKEIIMLVSGKQYVDSADTLSLLSIALVFNIFNWFWTRCVVYPFKLEGKMMVIAIVAGLSNVILNIFILPRYGRNGAALTTIFSEIISTIGYAIISKKYISRINIRDIIKPLAGSLLVVFDVYVIKIFIKDFFLCITLSVVTSAFFYAIVECYLFKDELKLLFFKGREHDV